MKWQGLIAIIIAICFVAAGVIIQQHTRGDGYMFYWFFCCLTVPILLLYAVTWGIFGRHDLYVHEGGVRRVGADGERVFAYAEFCRMDYAATQMIHSGVISTSTIRLGLWLADGSKLRIFKGWFGKFGGGNEGLERARDLAAAALAPRIADALTRGNAVEWTGGLVIEPSGLRLRDGTVVPWSRLRLDMCHGILELRTAYPRRKVGRVRASKPNFYPGLHVIEGEMASAAADRAENDEDEDEEDPEGIYGPDPEDLSDPPD